MFPWFWVWAPQWQLPFSGSVAQRIEPDTRWFFNGIEPQAGDGALEQRIHEDIASYGRQLGLIGEVLLGLAGSDKVTADQAARSLARLEGIHAEIAALKEREQDAARQAALRALDKLAATDPAGLAQVLRRYADPARLA